MNTQGVSAAHHCARSLSLIGLTISLLTPTAGRAQAPSSLAGAGVFVQYTGGTPPLVSYGYSMFLPANSGNSYQLVGIYPAGGNSGTYTYTTTGANTGQAVQNDITDGISFRLNLSFSSATQGSFTSATISPAGYSQTGNFWAAIASAPSSVTGTTFRCTVLDGMFPFASGGSFVLTFAPSGNTYTVTGTGGVANSSGTYSYSLFNRSTAVLQVNDSVAGASSLYIGFSTPTSGAYSAKQATTSGFQIATFSVLDTTVPTVTITSPINGQRWTNAAFNLSGKATDNVGIAGVYYQVGNTGWHPATTTNNWANWSATILPVPGTNVIQAYSTDTSGNTSPVASRNLDFVVQAPLAIQITGAGTVTPDLNGQFLEIGQPFSLTAKPASGSVFTNWVISTNWVGGVISNSSSLNLIMRSNLTLQANFLMVPAPMLSLVRLGTNVVLTWATNVPGYSVESATNFLVGGWNTNYPVPVVVNGRYTVTNPIIRPVKVYRLRKP